MAMLPCDRGPHFNPFRNSSYYVALGSGGNFTRWLLRLCPVHAAVVNEDLAEYEIIPEKIALGITDTNTDCFACGEPIDEARTQLFVTGYPAKDERKDYWACVHLNCSLPPHLAQPDKAAV